MNDQAPVTLASVQRAAAEGNYDVLYYVVMEHALILWHITGDAVEEITAPLRDLARAADDEPDTDWLAPSEVPDHLGRLGPYEVVDRVGQGAMGVVYKEHDAARHGETVAKARNYSPSK